MAPRTLGTQVIEKVQDAQFLVGLSGLEPPTSRLSGVRSNRLSYRPIRVNVGFLSLSHIFIQYFCFNVHISLS